MFRQRMINDGTFYSNLSIPPLPHPYFAQEGLKKFPLAIAIPNDRNIHTVGNSTSVWYPFT